MGKSHTEIMTEREAGYQAQAKLHIKNNPHLSQDVKGFLSRSALSYCLSAVHKLGAVEGVEPSIPTFERFMKFITEREYLPPASFLDAVYEYEYKGMKTWGAIQARTQDGGWSSRVRKVFRVSLSFKGCLRGQPSQDKPDAAMKKLEVAIKSWKREIDIQQDMEGARWVEFAHMREIFGNNVERPFSGSRMRIRPDDGKEYPDRFIEFISGNGRININNVNGYLSEDQFKRIADIFFEEEVEQEEENDA